jgi:hypothetical protein
VTDPPRIRVGPFRTEGEPGAWTVRWPVRNDGDRAARILAATQPHSQFRTAERAVALDLPPGGAADLPLEVTFAVRPGEVVENPFLLVEIDDGRRWRLFARVRVSAGSRGEPIADPSVVVTMQEIRGAT